MSVSHEPKLLLTWSFGPVGAQAAWPSLVAGADALDCVIDAATAIEDDPTIDSVGVGGLPDSEGHVSLDGCVMTNPDRCGGVCFVRNYANVCQIARAVMERTIHVTLSGDGAEQFAQREGFHPRNLLTPEAKHVWEQWRTDPRHIDRDKYKGWLPPINWEELHAVDEARVSPGEPLHDTVGILGIDTTGKLAGACSTSGMAFKVPGRVGDSPIIGQGLYVDQQAGAATATGTGELIAGICGSFLVVEEMRRGATPVEAILAALTRLTKRFKLHDEHQVAFCAMDTNGQWATGALRKGFKHTIADKDGIRVEEPTITVLE
jgi:isoaspartyl peptidase/L-asparaginase-like protein (Ntn-hydrolase superfamily)